MKKLVASLFLPQATVSIFCPWCIIETSAWLLSELKLMALILNIAINAQINRVFGATADTSKKFKTEII